MVGEQPGDQEDIQGEPFVGPVGKLLDKAMAEAEIDRALVYVTNAVKHFKLEAWETAHPPEAELARDQHSTAVNAWTWDAAGEP
jgi:DNA polymerase